MDPSKPRASPAASEPAAKIVEHGSRVALDLEGSYVENKSKGERMEVQVKDWASVRCRRIHFETGDGGATFAVRCLAFALLCFASLRFASLYFALRCCVLLCCSVQFCSIMFCCFSVPFCFVLFSSSFLF